MNTIKTIIVCRCVAVANQEITAYGFMQAQGVGKQLQRSQYNIQRLVYCDAPTRQAAVVIAAAAQLYIQPEEMASFLPRYKAGGLEELQTLSLNKATTYEALYEKENKSACLMRTQLTKALLCLATDMQNTGDETALVVSHSLFAELATSPNERFVPLGLGEGDCMVYGVEDLRFNALFTKYIISPSPSYTKF